MSDSDGSIYALLEKATTGPVGDPPTQDIVRAGRQRLRRRRGLQVVGVVAAVALVVAGVVTVAGHTATRPTQKPLPVTAGPIPGPTAARLAAGRWIRMPTSPVALCNPEAVWDGRDLVVFEGPFNHCKPVAATYNPPTNRWAVITPPPAAVGLNPVAAWGGGRLVLVATKTGDAFAWRPSTDRWQRIATLPATGIGSLLWTGQSMVAITADQTRVSRAFILDADGWAALPNLPRPRRNVIETVDAVVDSGSIYVYATLYFHHDNPSDSFTSGHGELLRLSAGRWMPVGLPGAAPKSFVSLTQVAGGIAVVGSVCPGMCTEQVVTALLLRPTGSPRSVALRPLNHIFALPYPQDVAAGAGVVVVTYPDGSRSLGELIAPGSGPPTGATDIYDTNSGRWLRGPTAPTSSDAAGTYWTPFGVASLGSDDAAGSQHLGGWLLRPSAS